MSMEFLKGRRGLFFCAQQHHLLKMMPVVEELENRGAEIVVITSQNGNNEFSGCFELPLLERKLPYLFLHDFFDQSILLSSRNDAREIVNTLTQTSHRLDSNSAFSDLGLHNAIFEAAENLHLTRKCLDMVRPDFGLILYEGNFWTKVFAYLCSSSRIPIVSFQEGIYTSRKGFWTRQYVKSLSEYSDKVLLWGSAVRDAIAPLSDNPEKFVIIGAPHSDLLFKQRESFNHAEFRQAVRACPEQRVISLMMPSDLPVPEQAIRYFHGLVEHAGAIGLVKFRPAGDFEFYRHISERYASPQMRFYYNEDPIPLILGADLVISGNSTIGVEALLLGKDIIFLKNDPSHEDLYSLGDAALTTIVLDRADISPVLEILTTLPQMFSSQRGKSFVESQIYGFDGSATIRACVEISKTLQSWARQE